ncbi:hypothetical protein [Nonomuraea sp. NPDC049695]|uniref:hypothetical protein n=1 Tax=Nonomuraea sp. NPDC049695 TaxID=3154734 RepID=UPI00343F0881
MTEVDYDEIERLQERVNSYELMAALTPAEFDDYFAVESDLENRIAAFADLCAGYLNFSTASEAFDEIIELNRRLREICGRELDRAEPPPGEEYRDRLRAAQIEAHALTLLAEGVKRTFQAEDRRLRGDLNSTLAYLEGAREYFIERRGVRDPCRVARGAPRPTCWSSARGTPGRKRRRSVGTADRNRTDGTWRRIPSRRRRSDPPKRACASAGQRRRRSGRRRTPGRWRRLRTGGQAEPTALPRGPRGPRRRAAAGRGPSCQNGGNALDLPRFVMAES